MLALLLVRRARFRCVSRDLRSRLDLVVMTSGVTDSEQARSRLAPQVLRSLIEERLQLQEAERLSLNVADQEIERAIVDIAQRNKLTPDEMRRYLQDSGVELSTWYAQLRAQIAWFKVINRQIRPQISVSVDQLDLAMQEARRDQGQPEFLLSEIVRTKGARR